MTVYMEQRHDTKKKERKISTKLLALNKIITTKLLLVNISGGL